MNAPLPDPNPTAGERVDVPGLVVVRGGGDLATGIVQKLVRAGLPVVVLETAAPAAIRWRAALCPAVWEGRWAVEDLVGVRAESWESARDLLASGEPGVVPVLVDPEARLLTRVRPWAVVDAVIAKRNVGTHRGMAPVTVGCGPGFVAGEDVDLVVETMRGHTLGAVLTRGAALPNTGVPGLIAGAAHERVIHAPAAGTIVVRRGIGAVVAEGEVLATIQGAEGETEVVSTLAGVVRGMIPDGYRVGAGLKIADVDPRTEMADACDTISDKSRAVGGAALEAVLWGLRRAGVWPGPAASAQA